jgi:hypothetical protein
VIPDTQHEKYAELCAVFTTGSLTGPELRELKAHLQNCQTCCALLSDYREIAHEGVPAVASENLDDVAVAGATGSMRAQKRRLFAQLARNEVLADIPTAISTGIERFSSLPWFRVAARYVAPGLAAGLLLAVGYLLGARQHHVGNVAAPNLEADRRNSGEFGLADEVHAGLEATLRAKEKEIGSLNDRIESAAKEVKRLRQVSDEASSARDLLNEENARVASENVNLLRNRHDLEQSADQAQASLASAQEELAKLRAQREKDLTQSADLQNQIAALTSKIAAQEKTMAEERKLLESDKDIRDLMGARDLYIADVYDMDSDNRNPKPFGRVFYTKHKSLIFYAFDLDQQGELRATSTFQAWGLKEGDKDHPLSMGIFYRDNEIHRRWVLKFEDQRVLDQIQAVFVTVEPAGGSHKPRGRQLLYASLRMTPNHP